MAQTVLIVEDENKLRDLLQSNLRAEGFEVHACSSFEETGIILKEKSIVPEIVILDRLLNGADGIGLIEPIKRAYSSAKVIILSAINTAVEKAAALDRGADDYLGKPFSTLELIARIRAVSRRQVGPESASHVQIGRIIIDPVTRVVSVDDRRLNLPNKEFLILRILAQNPGKVYSKAVLFEQAWDATMEVETNVVEVTINNLRRRIENLQAGVRIRNMRNTGYWIEV
jgi:two-component system, OmpR family, response regulator